MTKYFNVAGPCNESKHYMVPVIQRNQEIQDLIDHEQYYIIQAARQTGKTTLVKAYVNDLNSKGEYYALYCSLESAHVLKDPRQGIPEILNIIRRSFKYSKLPYKNQFSEHTNTESISGQIIEAFSDYCTLLDKPLVVFFDEVDGLQDGTLFAFLRQIRDGYVNRPEIPFVHSVGLVGLKSIRDFIARIRSSDETASPLNIVTTTLSLSNFTYSEIEQLYEQHTLATDHVFEKKAIEVVAEYTSGQPWLVNAIAREVVIEILKNDYSCPITSEHVLNAIQNIVMRSDTHIESLLDKLKEERVRKVIEPIIIGGKGASVRSSEDTEYCLDLGLIHDVDGELRPANSIYGEIIIRALSFDSQYDLQTEVKDVCLDEDGHLDMDALIRSFQFLWRENADNWQNRYQYQEAAPFLIFQAFLQRFVDGKGRIIREYGIKRTRFDLCVIYQGRFYPIVMKNRLNTISVDQGITQICSYLDVYGLETGWLVLFDNDDSRSLNEKISWRTLAVETKTIHVVGC